MPLHRTARSRSTGDPHMCKYPHWTAELTENHNINFIFDVIVQITHCSLLNMTLRALHMSWLTFRYGKSIFDGTVEKKTDRNCGIYWYFWSRELGVCGYLKFGSDSDIEYPNRPKIWHPYRCFSDRNCVQSAVQIKSDKITLLAFSVQIKNVLK